MAAYAARSKITEVRAMKKTKCFFCKQIKQCKKIRLYDRVISNEDENWFGDGNWCPVWVCPKCWEDCEEIDFNGG